MNSLSSIAFRVRKNEVEKGFDEGLDLRSFPVVSMKIMLIVTELAEAVEDLRVDGVDGIELPKTNADGKPVGFGSEIADAIIRCLTLAESLKIDIQNEVLRKHAFNMTRPKMHGKKF